MTFQIVCSYENENKFEACHLGDYFFYAAKYKSDQIDCFKNEIRRSNRFFNLKKNNYDYDYRASVQLYICIIINSVNIHTRKHV
jgi:hypothetical protein